MNRYLRCLLCFFLLAAAAASAQDNKLVPESLVRAKYVYIGILQSDGGAADGMDRGLSPQDREVRDAVEKAFRQWKRYTVTITPDNADLIVLVRKGRYGSVTLGGTPVRISGGAKQDDRRAKSDHPGRAYPDVTVAAEAGPIVDLLEVRIGPNRGGDTRLWQRSRKDGFVGIPPYLFQEFKNEIEQLAKKLGL